MCSAYAAYERVRLQSCMEPTMSEASLLGIFRAAKLELSHAPVLRPPLKVERGHHRERLVSCFLNSSSSSSASLTSNTRSAVDDCRQTKSVDRPRSRLFPLGRQEVLTLHCDTPHVMRLPSFCGVRTDKTAVIAGLIWREICYRGNVTATEFSCCLRSAKSRTLFVHFSIPRYKQKCHNVAAEICLPKTANCPKI
jgi:hypothetical protein